MTPRLCAGLAGAGVLLVAAALGARPLPAPVPVRPGTLVRWPGEGIESCSVGERRFTPLAGACVFAVDLLQPKGALVVGRVRAGRRESATLRIGPFDYPVQKLTVPPGYVELSAADAERVRRENADVARLWERAEGERRFALPLAPPLNPLPQGGRFGSRRVINGQPRAPHGGADFSAAEGTPVAAAADGVVALVGDHFFGGRSVFVDHGDGLFTMYFHLSRVDVAEGQPLKRGERLGAVGHTGRATGPHLHFGARWHRARIDPRLLLEDPGRLPAIG